LERSSYGVLVGKPEGKGSLEGPRHIWDGNIKIDLREAGLEVWSGFIWLRIETSSYEYGSKPADSLIC
jgi:hypothetical protein